MTSDKTFGISVENVRQYNMHFTFTVNVIAVAFYAKKIGTVGGCGAKNTRIATNTRMGDKYKNI